MEENEQKIMYSELYELLDIIGENISFEFNSMSDLERIKQ